MPPQTTIHVLRGDQLVEVLTFSQPQIFIGRRREFQHPTGVGTNDVVLNAPRISTRHAKLVVDAEGILVVDTSQNGTYIGSERVLAPRRLLAGECIAIDDFNLRCELMPADAPIAAPRNTAPNLTLPPPSDPPTPTFPAATSPDFELVPRDQGLPQLDLAPHDSPPEPVASPPPATSPVSAPSLPLSTLNPVAAPAPGPPPRDPLSHAYRHLAARFGSPGWGRPASVGLDSLPQVTDTARTALRGHGSPGPWADRLARELCEFGPLASLLDDPSVTQIVVRGSERIDVTRGALHEEATTHFSCPEALRAVLERWTGERLTTTLSASPTPDLCVRAWAGLTATPLVIVTRVRATQRSTLGDLVLDQTLPQSAADLLTGALLHDHNLLLCGTPGTDLATVLIALGGELQPSRSVCVLRRTATWPRSHALVLAGDDPNAWPCVRALTPDWLLIDELSPTEARDLAGYARHRGGGTLASLRAGSPEAALARLAAALATASGGELAPARALAGSCFDGLISLHSSPSGRLYVDSICEVRPHGELAELFAWNPEVTAVQPTLIEAQVLR